MSANPAGYGTRSASAIMGMKRLTHDARPEDAWDEEVIFQGPDCVYVSAATSGVSLAAARKPSAYSVTAFIRINRLDVARYAVYERDSSCRSNTMLHGTPKG
jgi:hypothetical protein